MSELQYIVIHEIPPPPKVDYVIFGWPLCVLKANLHVLNLQVLFFMFFCDNLPENMNLNKTQFNCSSLSRDNQPAKTSWTSHGRHTGPASPLKGVEFTHKVVNCAILVSVSFHYLLTM